MVCRRADPDADFSAGDRIGVTSGLSFRYSYNIFSTITLCSYMMLKCYNAMTLYRHDVKLLENFLDIFHYKSILL